jgi:hypothetical protein
MRSSNRNWDEAIMKDEAGADFTITPPSVSPHMASSFPSGAVFPPQHALAMLDYAPRHSRKTSGRVDRRIRPERHNPHSIATLRTILGRYLARLLPHCPCCGSPGG